jgi:hypothetical protein
MMSKPPFVLWFRGTGHRIPAARRRGRGRWWHRCLAAAARRRAGSPGCPLPHPRPGSAAGRAPRRGSRSPIRHRRSSACTSSPSFGRDQTRRDRSHSGSPDCLRIRRWQVPADTDETGRHWATERAGDLPDVLVELGTGRHGRASEAREPSPQSGSGAQPGLPDGIGARFAPGRNAACRPSPARLTSPDPRARSRVPATQEISGAADQEVSIGKASARRKGDTAQNGQKEGPSK